MGRLKTTEKYALQSLDFQVRQGKVWLNPIYQRESVWTRSQKQLLIDSLLNDIDIPKLYFRAIDKNGHEFEVVDGQQRLRAISDFLGSEFPLSKKSKPVEGHVTANRDFSSLPTPLQMKLQNAQLDVVVLLKGYTDDDIEEIFLRLQNGTPLNAAEKRKALPGEMKTIVAALAEHAFFEELCGFSSKRFGYEDAAAKVLHLLLRGTLTDIREGSIRATYEQWKTIEPDNPEVATLKKAMNFLRKAFKGKPNPKFKKFSAISLLYLTVELLESYDLQKYPSEFGEAYLKFEAKRAENDDVDEEDQDPRFLAYANAARADSIPELEYRHKTLAEELLMGIPELLALDEQRQFRQEQRLAIFLRDQGICQECGTKCKDTDWHADHKKPHSRGGKTTISNGQVLCPTCNLKKGNAA
jgi:hypothetical protein